MKITFITLNETSTLCAQIQMSRVMWKRKNKGPVNSLIERKED